MSMITPSPEGSARSWRKVLGVESREEEEVGEGEDEDGEKEGEGERN